MRDDREGAGKTLGGLDPRTGVNLRFNANPQFPAKHSPAR